ncbi:MAG: putative N-acetylmannosaminyltransferase [candidate division BRC1 bacterium ADurb.BinA364]|nr:MAG: putative N-acetylmannosaminyltransferase [candidate division BRC1 bacterium ADurb.BinA364]
MNAHNANLAFRDPEFAAILALADLAYADGMGVVWGWGLLGRPLPERVNAGDFIAEFCRRAAARGVSLYLLGGRPGVAAEAARRWTQAAPGLRVAGTRHGYFTAEEEPALAEAVRQAAPDILLVGMGAPRQEKWARRWAEPIGAPVVWCVGALFEYWGEARPRAPVWMRRGGLEWAWRLALEPRRLGRRYLIGNLEFLLNLRRLRRAIREEKAQAGDADGQGKGSP